MPRDVVKQVTHAEAHGIGDKHFHRLLYAAGLIDREPFFQPQEENCGESKHHQLHRDVVGNRILPRLGLDMKYVEQCENGLAEQPIDQFRDAQYLFFHFFGFGPVRVEGPDTRPPIYKRRPINSYRSSARTAATTTKRPARKAAAGSKEYARIT